MALTFPFSKRMTAASAGVRRLRPGKNLNSAAHKPIMSNRRLAVFAVFGVAGAAQVGNDLLRVDRLTHATRSWDAHRCLAAVLNTGPAMRRSTSPRVLHVEVGEHRHKDDAGDEESRDKQLYHRIAEGEVARFGRPCAEDGRAPPSDVLRTGFARPSGSLILIATFMNAQRSRSL